MYKLIFNERCKNILIFHMRFANETATDYGALSQILKLYSFPLFPLLFFYYFFQLISKITILKFKINVFNLIIILLIYFLAYFFKQFCVGNLPSIFILYSTKTLYGLHELAFKKLFQMWFIWAYDFNLQALIKFCWDIHI